MNEMLKLTDKQTIEKYVIFLGSHPNGIVCGFTGNGYIYKKRFRTIPEYYSHTFILTYDSLISFKFDLITDSVGQFSINYNNKYRDYNWLKGYLILTNNKKEFDLLMNTGVKYFGDKCFTIYFSTKKVVDYEQSKNFTTQEIFDIKNSERMYELVDKDSFHDKANQHYERKGIIIDPITKKITSEFKYYLQYSH